MIKAVDSDVKHQTKPKMLDSTDLETPTAHKTKKQKRKTLLVIKLSDVVFIMLINIRNASDFWHFTIMGMTKDH